MVANEASPSIKMYLLTGKFTSKHCKFTYMIGATFIYTQCSHLSQKLCAYCMGTCRPSKLWYIGGTIAIAEYQRVTECQWWRQCAQMRISTNLQVLQGEKQGGQPVNFRPNAEQWDMRGCRLNQGAFLDDCDRDEAVAKQLKTLFRQVIQRESCHAASDSPVRSESRFQRVVRWDYYDPETARAESNWAPLQPI